MKALALALLLPLAQDPTPAPPPTPQDPPKVEEKVQEEEEEREPLVPSEHLLCLDRKVASGDGIGLWYRSDDGEMERVWDGEPYDAEWQMDRSVLVVERWAGRVALLSPDFEVVQSVSGFRTPVDVERTQDGLWLVVESELGRVVAVNPRTGERVYTRTGFTQPFDAAALADGGMLVADSGRNRIVRLDKDGKQVKVWTGINFPNTVDPTEDGGFLVTNWTGGTVYRYDAKGELSWRNQVGGTLHSAEERPDGRIVACDGDDGRLVYMDEKGKIERVDRFKNGCVDCETIIRP